MIEQQIWNDVKCQKDNHSQNNNLQFVCLEKGCQNNILCAECIINHDHKQQTMTISNFKKSLLEMNLDGQQCTTLSNFNKHKKHQLQKFEDFIQKLKFSFQELQKEEHSKFVEKSNLVYNLKKEIPITGYSQISSYIQRLSEIIFRDSNGVLQFKESQQFFVDSLESLKNMIQKTFDSNFNSKIKITFQNDKQIQQTHQPLQRSATQSQIQINKPDSEPKLFQSQLNSKIRLMGQKQITFTFMKDNTEIIIEDNGKRAKQVQKGIQDKHDRVAYLSPNLNNVNESIVSFQLNTISTNWNKVKFGVYVCDSGLAEYPKTRSAMETNGKFYLFTENPSYNQVDVLQLRFLKDSQSLEFIHSQNHRENISIKKEEQNKQFIFCFVVQPGSVINLTN